MRLAAALTLAVLMPALATAQPDYGRSCPVTPLIKDSAPPDNADPIVSADWYINADRSMWAGPVPLGGWSAGGVVYEGSRPVRGQKTYWVRPAGLQLVIGGRRLDAAAPPLEARIPCCYTSGFQIVALFFPTEGCWEVSANAGSSRLRFVTQVRGEDARH